MAELFTDLPDALSNTLNIAEQCAFNLASDLGYTLPEPAVPSGYTPDTYLKRLCSEAALRRYDTVTSEVEARLDEEFRLIARHRLAGFLLLYREIVLLAQKIMEEKGLAHPETPLEERPPVRCSGFAVRRSWSVPLLTTWRVTITTDAEGERMGRLSCSDYPADDP